MCATASNTAFDCCDCRCTPFGQSVLRLPAAKQRWECLHMQLGGRPRSRCSSRPKDVHTETAPRRRPFGSSP